MKIKLDAGAIWVSQASTDFRCGVDGLCAKIVESFEEQPTAGIYVFYNSAKNRIKILGWHGNGFVLLYKRLETGKFKMHFSEDKKTIAIDVTQLSWLIAGLDWKMMSEWKNEINFEEYF